MKSIVALPAIGLSCALLLVLIPGIRSGRPHGPPEHEEGRGLAGPAVDRPPALRDGGANPHLSRAELTSSAGALAADRGALPEQERGAAQVVWDLTRFPAEGALLEFQTGADPGDSWTPFGWNAPTAGGSRTDSQGRFELPRWLPSTAKIRARWGTCARWTSDPQPLAELRRGGSLALRHFEPSRSQPMIAAWGRLVAGAAPGVLDDGACVTLMVNGVESASTPCTAGDGVFLFPEVLLPDRAGLPALEFHGLSARGYLGSAAVSTFTPGCLIENVEIEAREARGWSGTVVGAERGQPLPGATIHVYERGPQTMLGSGRPRRLLAGAGGNFVVPQLPGHRVEELCVAKPGYSPVLLSAEALPGEPTGQPLLVRLPPAARIEGTVHDAEGAAAPPGTMVVWSSAHPARWDSALRRRQVAAGAQGRFRFDDLPAGDCVLAVMRAPEEAAPQPARLGMEPLEALDGRQELSLAAGEQRVVKLELGRSHRVQGRIDGRQATRDWVVTVADAQGRVVAQSLADESGTFSLEIDYCGPAHVYARSRCIGFDERGEGSSTEELAAAATTLLFPAGDLLLEVPDTELNLLPPEPRQQQVRFVLHLEPKESLAGSWSSALGDSYALFGGSSGFLHQSRGLPPGKYQLVVETALGHRASAELCLSPGSPTTVDLAKLLP